MKETLITRNVDFEISQDEDNNKWISGYYIVFNEDYNICDGISESIDPNAFNNTLQDDIRCLWNHNSDIVLGRTTANTLMLRVDSHGVYAKCLVNPNDTDALNAWARVSRKDVTGASFGFDIVREDTEVREDNSVHYTIREVKLYEISPCIFPAYESTAIEARQKDAENIKKRKAEKWRTDMLTKLKGVQK